ncbi:hypothetical protein JCM10914A_00370 [Paenibacillus sp. JCM 10914]|uniref:hypothetical protein n=1 Tax=Paenibacillus sp. JCM 10914 TaxID=1236974 RepID=UPI0003CCA235|nr:hypothetical protein [Paenibacillus sp. JCM 10914]GAE08556.1 hypothetical protein JCM10914_4859 [Paenibacillus sp. JCM 10914]
MLNFAIAACVILFAVAGYIAFMNSRLIAEQKKEAYIPPPISEYTVYMTPHFSEDDKRALVPIGVMEYRDADAIMKIYLCRVLNESEDLKLEDAGRVFLQHLTAARDSERLMFYRTVEEALQGPDEKALTDRLTVASKKKARPE